MSYRNDFICIFLKNMLTYWWFSCYVIALLRVNSFKVPKLVRAKKLWIFLSEGVCPPARDYVKATDRKTKNII